MLDKVTGSNSPLSSPTSPISASSDPFSPARQRTAVGHERKPSDVSDLGVNTGSDDDPSESPIMRLSFDRERTNAESFVVFTYSFYPQCANMSKSTIANLQPRVSVAAISEAQPTRVHEPAEELKPEFWMPDTTRACYECHTPFNAFTRRHHCRVCGHIFCGRCTDRVLPSLGHKPLRVCNYCYVKQEMDGPQVSRSSSFHVRAAYCAGMRANAICVYQCYCCFD